MRLAVASLFLASVLAAGVVAPRQGDDAAERASAAVPTTTPAPQTVPSTTPAPPTSPPPPPTPPPPPPPAPAPAPAPAGAADAKVLVSPRGVVLSVLGREGGGYRVMTPCGKSTVVRSGTPVTDAAVVLDAGHGGVEPGAVGPNGVSEKVINLAVVDHARAALERSGVRTVRTRTDDYRMTLAARAQVALALRPEAFVSVHHNAEPDGPFPRPGTETYYQVASAESRRLSGLVYEEVVAALSAYQVPWVADTDAGAKYRRNTEGDDYYGVLRRTKGVTAVLAELAFVSNPPEANLLTRPDVQQVEGEAVARGILRFLGTPDPGSGYVEPYPRSSPAGSGGGGVNCVDPPL